jgi:nucleoid-associated protein YgaU
LKELESSGFIDKLYKSTVVAKAAPRSEPAPATAPAKANVQVADAKTKPVTAEEKAKPVAKPAPATPEPVAAVKAKMAVQEYTVKGGDTLGRIAEQLLGSGAKWGKIYEANRESVKNPDYIFIGQKLNIPADG